MLELQKLDTELEIPKPLDDFFQELHLEMTERNSIFDAFQIEKGDYTELFNKKLEKVNKVVSDIYGQMDEIKSMYDKLNVSFDLWNGESTVNDSANELIDKPKNSLFTRESLVLKVI